MDEWREELIDMWTDGMNEKIGKPFKQINNSNWLVIV